MVKAGDHHGPEAWGRPEELQKRRYEGLNREPLYAAAAGPGGGGDASWIARAQFLKELGQLAAPPQTGPDIHFLPIIGQIEGHVALPPKNKTTKYEHVIPQLAALEQDDRVRGVLIILNTVGGDIEAGLAIAEMIRGLSKPTVSLVLGGGHSIGVPIAVAADYSLIAHTATMTIHPIRLAGMLIGVPQTYEYLDKMQDRIIRFVVENSRISEQRLREMMFRTGELVRDVGTVLVGKDAVEAGLIHQVGSVGEALTILRRMMARGKNPVPGWVAPSMPAPAPPGFPSQAFPGAPPPIPPGAPPPSPPGPPPHALPTGPPPPSPLVPPATGARDPWLS